jgi:hypothetical protein
MSSNLAYARPNTIPVREEPRPHITAVSPRQRRKSRPRVVYAIATVASLFVIFTAQLLLSIVVSDGAYQIASLQGQQKELLRTQENLTEKLDLLGSTQNLAANAAHLGMIPGTSPLFLNLETGAIAAAPGSVDRPGCGGACNLVANDLLTGVPLVTPAPANAGSATGTKAATTATTAGGSSTSPTPTVQSLPAPVTH